MGGVTLGPGYGVGGQILDEAGILRTVNRAFATPSSSGNTEIVAAQGAGVRIRVIACLLISAEAVSVKFQSATTDISATFALAANAGFVIPDLAHGWLQTVANQALNLNLSGNVSTGIQLIWVKAS